MDKERYDPLLLREKFVGITEKTTERLARELTPHLRGFAKRWPMLACCSVNASLAVGDLPAAYVHPADVKQEDR